MSFLKFFREAAPAPWTAWPECKPRVIKYDARTAALEGVTFEAPMETLEVFGRPDNPDPLSSQSFVFAPLGLDVAVDRNGTVFSFTCVFSEACSDIPPTEFESFSPCQVSIRGPQHEILVTRDTTAPAIERALGKLTAEESYGEVLHIVRLASSVLQFGFDEYDKLQLLDIEPV